MPESCRGRVIEVFGVTAGTTARWLAVSSRGSPSGDVMGGHVRSCGIWDRGDTGRRSRDSQARSTLPVVNRAGTCGNQQRSERALPRDHAGQGSNMSDRVDASGLEPNTLQRFDRLSSAWNQARSGIVDGAPSMRGDDSQTVREPTSRTRTPLTAKEIDAMRTAKERGESVPSIAKRFNVHRMTVWTHTK